MIGEKKAEIDREKGELLRARKRSKEIRRMNCDHLLRNWVPRTLR